MTTAIPTVLFDFGRIDAEFELPQVVNIICMISL